MSPAVPNEADDRRWMEQALALAALGEGATSPNPRVGCLLVREGRVVGSGYHRAYGAPHAEAVALERAGELARGSTAYVNLEPCAHEGHTPPCAGLLAGQGVERVVAALRDPNPLVDGRGLARLRDAGVRVETGLLADEARTLNEPFLHRHTKGRPLVTIKAATSLDGLLSADAGASRWISGAAARRFAHRLRFGHDAVLVGARTARRDDPRLTVRLNGASRDPVRVVLAPGLDLDPEARLFRNDGGIAGPRIYCGSEAGADREHGLSDRATVVRVGFSAAGLDLRRVLSDLLELGVQSVLVEGGARTIGAFVAAGLADRVALFQTNRLLGARGATPLVDLESVSEPALGWRLDHVRQLSLGEDRLLLGRLRAPEGDC